MRTQKLTSTADHLVVTPEEELADRERCEQLNNAWNARIAAEREERLAAKLAARKEHILQRLELAEERRERQLAEVEELVRREKLASATFILKDNLDAAIEHALANPVDYNFAIDLQGNVLAGRRTDVKDVQSVATGNGHAQEVGASAM